MLAPANCYISGVSVILKCRIPQNVKRCFGQVLPRLYSSRQSLSPIISDIRQTSFVRTLKRCASSNSLAKEGPSVRRSDVKRLFSLAKPEKWRLACGVGLLLVSSTVTMAVPFAVGKIINLINSEDDHDVMLARLQHMSVALLAVFVVGALANGARFYLMQTSGQRIVKRMREQLYSSIVQQEIAFFDKNKTGELITRLSTDTTLIGNSMTMNISDGLRSVAMALGSVSMMFYVCPRLACVGLAIVPPMAAVSIVYGRYVKTIVQHTQTALATSTQVAEARLSSMRTVRAFTGEAREVARYAASVAEVLRLGRREAAASGLFWAATGLSGNLVVLAVFYAGGEMMTSHELSVGDLAAFLLYAAYTGMAMGGLSGFFSTSMKALGASSRVWELTDRVPAIALSGGQCLPDIKGDLEFHNVHFAYPERPDVDVFSDLCLRIPAGRVSAVAGRSGCGKSSLFALLLRYYEPCSGRLTLDGSDIGDLDPSWLRANIGVVSQDPTLFSTSVGENIAYGAAVPGAVCPQDVERVARLAQAHAFITAMPRGYDTPVGERGVLLSGGQTQRLAIARALLRDPRILLLDEATSALDDESEHAVQLALQKLMAGRTVLTIAHRLSTIRQADHIVVLEQGRLVQQGTWAHLITHTDGVFHNLVQRQAHFERP